MSDENGFVERPDRHGSRRNTNSILGRLRATAENGKAIRLTYTAGRFSGQLKSQGFQVHSAKQPDGTHLGWCERIEPAKVPTP